MADVIILNRQRQAILLGISRQWEREVKSTQHDLKGRLIVIEGADGCGKTTQARLLADYLRGKGRPVLLVREPGGTPLGEEIRRALLNPAHKSMSAPTELLLYMACRSQLTSEVIRPALEDGKTVICDRYLLSSVVYQGYAGGLGVDIVYKIGAFATENIQPAVQIIIDVAYETAVARRSVEADRIEARGESFHRKVIEGYRAAVHGVKGVHVMDGNRSVDEVQKDIRRIVDNVSL
jgi:dTMP kinase